MPRECRTHRNARQKAHRNPDVRLRGDVEPFIALGVGLQNAGHAVRLAGPAPFALLVEAYGLEFDPIEGNPDELAQAFADRAGPSWPRMVAKMIQHVLPLAGAAFRTVEIVVRDADLIVHSFLMTDAGHTLARSRGVPDISAQFFRYSCLRQRSPPWLYLIFHWDACIVGQPTL